MSDPTGPANVPPGAPPLPGKPLKPGRRFVLTFVELIIVICIIGVLAAISTPKFSAARPRANTRACYANQKTVVGAIEMYNLDKNTKRTTLDATFFLALKSGGYLQSIPQDPGAGPGSSVNYGLTATGNGIRCTVHGQIQGGSLP